MKRALDKWCDNLWIYFMCLVGGVSLGLLITDWSTLTLGAKGGLFCAIIMPLHVIEEWKLPGGLHYFYNTLLGPKNPKEQQLDRYPMSRFTDMQTNLVMQLLPLVYAAISEHSDLSDAFAIAAMLFSALEVVAHTSAGFMTKKLFPKKRALYNPGLGTSYCLFLPAAIYLGCGVSQWSGRNWSLGILFLIIVLVISVPLAEFPFRKWVSRQEPGLFAFKSPRYFEQFIEKK